LIRVNVDSLKGSFEPEVYRGLQALKRKHRFDFEYEPEAFSYFIEHWYTPDWKVQCKDGSSFFIESKGYWRPDDRRKVKLVREQHPDIDLRMLFQNDPKLHKKSATRYSDWCKKHGILYAVGGIPEEWFS
jgi:hypothetical protein